jgi:hypothetical protein
MAIKSHRIQHHAPCNIILLLRRGRDNDDTYADDKQISMTGGPILCGIGGALNQRTLQKVRFNLNTTELHLLNISFEEQSLMALQILELFSNDNRQWKEISITECSGPLDAILECIVEKCERLKFCNCEMTETVTDAIARGLQSTSSHLVELRWKEGRLTGDCMWLLGEALRTTKLLKELNLGRTALEAEALDALAHSLRHNSSISVLSVFSCNLSDDQIALLVPSLPPRLEELYIGRNKCRSSGMSAIHNFLQSVNCQLVKLDLYEQELQEEECLDISFLTSALAQNKSLRTLSLSYNSIDEEAMEFLAEALTQNCTLQNLELKNSNITSRGLQLFTVRLREMHGLTTINFSGTQKFEDDDLKYLIEGLRTNVTLESIVLPRSNAESSEIDHYLDLNKGGRKLLRSDHVPLGLWPLVLERATDMMKFENEGIARSASIIYGLIRGPVLLER